MFYKLTVLASLLVVTPPALAQTASAPGLQTESTDVFIRRMAGLPAASAEGDIRIIDVGHFPTDTMISIVANRTANGWHVSYVCAVSPLCAPNQDHSVKEYDLSPEAGRQVEAILDRLKSDDEPERTPQSPTMICGHLGVVIHYKGLNRDYRRACAWGPTLGGLENLLKPPNS